MRQLTTEALQELLKVTEPPCISLYQPTHRANPDNLQDPGLQKLAKALNSPEVRQFIVTRYKGQIAPAF